MLPKTIQNTIDEFSKLPGVGPKTAARLTFYLLTRSKEDVKKFGQTIFSLRDNLIFCSKCYNIAESDPCEICNDEKRDNMIMCVVEESLDIVALEKTDYRGVYHVLGGVISPIDGIGPENLRIRQLLDRLKKNNFREIIMATDPSLEGEATASYIVDEIEKMKKNGNIGKDLKITRIARGLPVGGDLEYADEVTLSRALEGRDKFK
jgi:recombination protein RecR